MKSTRATASITTLAAVAIAGRYRDDEDDDPDEPRVPDARLF